jgi:HAD superfamily hydrolase (TIGR01662 family)
VVFTNQGGVRAGKTTVGELKSKFSKIQAALSIPMLFLGATDDDIYRKPSPEMWRYFCPNLNDGVKIDTSLSFYCGDAAGRPKTATKPKDFSDGDLKFALNSKISFFLPEDVLGSNPVSLPDLLSGVSIGTKKQGAAKGETAKLQMVADSGMGLEKLAGPIIKGGKEGDENRL